MISTENVSVVLLMAAILAVLAHLAIRLRTYVMGKRRIKVQIESPADSVRMTIELRGREAVQLWRSLKPQQVSARPKMKEVVEHANRPAHRFLIDCVTLFESFQHVTEAPDARVVGSGADKFKEVFHYASGIPFGKRTFVISHIVRVSFSQQHAGGVRVADSSNIRTLESLDELGLPLVAHFHSHPGFGEDANFPSPTDRRFQERLERGGHIAVGGIFSRDGYVRFFANDDDRFEIEVIGNKVKKVGKHAYKLELGDARVQVRAASTT